jgi:hypothetical protein
MQVFDKDQLHCINKGQVHRQVLQTQIHEALFNNPFNANYIISSMPGLGKSYETELAVKGMPIKPLVFAGTASMAAFTIEIATAVYLANGAPLTVVLDDCDVLFEDKNVNATKKMFDDTRCLRYGKVAKGLYSSCTDLQIEAIESFGSDQSAGFSVPLHNVTFIILTNRHLPTVNEVSALDPSSNKASRAMDLHAVRRRTEYKEIEMKSEELWGYVADVVLHGKICEKFMPNIVSAAKEQILEWCWTNWDHVTERNLSLIEKMTKDIVRYPQNYKDIWKTNYLQVKV